MKGAHWGFRQEKKVAYTSVINSHPVPQDIFEPCRSSGIVRVCLMVTGRTGQDRPRTALRLQTEALHSLRALAPSSHYFPYISVSPFFSYSYMLLVHFIITFTFIFASFYLLLSPFLFFLSTLLHSLRSQPPPFLSRERLRFFLRQFLSSLFSFVYYRPPLFTFHSLL